MPREYREERLVRVLREQIHESIQGAQEAVIVTNDGLVVAAYPSAGERQNALDEVGIQIPFPHLQMFLEDSEGLAALTNALGRV